MNWNWGKGIALSFTVFCGLMIFMVIQSFQQDFSLVSGQYYQDELKYQERIDELKRTRAAGLTLQTASDAEAVTFVINTNAPIAGKIHFYRPDDATLDHEVAFKNAFIRVGKEALNPGRYIAKISWFDKKESYYLEKEITID